MNSVTAIDPCQMVIDALTDEILFEVEVANVRNGDYVGMRTIHILAQQITFHYCLLHDSCKVKLGYSDQVYTEISQL